MNRQAIIAFVGGLAIGAATSYFVTKKIVSDRYEQIIEKEVAEVKEHYRLLRKEDYPTVEDFIRDKVLIDEEDREEYSDKVQDLGYSDEDADQPEESRVAQQASILKSNEDRLAEKAEFEAHVQSVWDRGVPAKEIIESLKDSDEGISYSDMKELRMEALKDARVDLEDGIPYVITAEEYQDAAQEPDMDALTLTYYAGDDTLVDERENVIPDAIHILGDDALVSFGVGSQDDAIVYVRNDNSQCIFEVVQDLRSYVEVVLGYSDKKGPQKFREDD